MSRNTPIRTPDATADDTGAAVERALVIRNKRGLHARASARFVNTTGRFTARITVAKDGIEVCGTSIMGLMMLAAAPGDTIHVRASGADAAAALEAVAELVDGKFGEE